MTFPKKTPDEIKLLTFKFTGEAPEGSVLTSPTVTATLLPGGTGTAADLDIDTGSITVTGLWVTVLVGQGLDGCKYRLNCQVNADNGEHHEIDKDLPVSIKGALVT